MTSQAHPDTVLIVDFGSQFTQLIARRVREAGVFSEIVFAIYDRTSGQGTLRAFQSEFLG